MTGVFPWNASFAVAPASVYEVPSSTVAGLSPLIVITGGTLSLYPSSVKDDTAATPAIAINAFWICDSSATISASLDELEAEPAELSIPSFSWSNIFLEETSWL